MAHMQAPMMRLFLAGVLWSLLVPALSFTAPRRPNIVMMVVDDLGFNDVPWGIHSEGGNIIKTPKLQALADQGTKLNNYYVYRCVAYLPTHGNLYFSSVLSAHLLLWISPVLLDKTLLILGGRFCSPTRSTFQTGRHPSHIGQQTEMNLNPSPGIACGISLKYSFIANVLKRAGYRTAALGKWHLGNFKAAYTPTLRGFDTYTGYYTGAEEHFTHIKSGPGSNNNVYDLANNSGPTLRPLKTMVGFAQNTTEKFYSAYIYANESIRLIRRHAREYGGQPLYMYIAWNNVHAPCEAPTDYTAMNKGEQNAQRQVFAGMLSALDDSALAVVDELRATAMWQNTVLVFSTDNGGNLGGGGNNLPFRGGKYTFWEGGVRGTAWVASPLLPKGAPKEWGGLMHAVDWYTTFAALAGASVENTGPLPPDGINIWPLLSTGAVNESRHVLIQCQSTNKFGQALNQTIGVVRKGPWKLVHGYPGWGKVAWDTHVPLPGPDEVLVGWGEEWAEGGHIPQQFRHALKDGEDARMGYGEGPVWPGNWTCDISGEAGQHCCSLPGLPCLFNVEMDKEENHDISAAHPETVAELVKLLESYAKTEVSVNASGICPTKYGVGVDPRCAEAAFKTTPPFWAPWL